MKFLFNFIFLSMLAFIPFELKASSDAINAGSNNIAEQVPNDFNGNSRLPNPDIGCLEKQ